MSRGDLLGAGIVVAWLSVVGALWLLERGAPIRPPKDARPIRTLVPDDHATLPEDHAVFEVKRGKDRIGRVEADQGRADIPALSAVSVPGSAYVLRRRMVLDLAGLHVPGATVPEGLQLSSALEASLARDLSILDFTFEGGSGSATPGPASGFPAGLLSAHGTLSGSVARVTIRLGEHTEDLTVPLTIAPLLEEAALPLLAASGDLARPGTRARLSTLDPQTGRPDTILIEVVGPEIVALSEAALGAGAPVVSGIKVVRDAGGSSPRAVWADPEGRVLREELPLGLLAVRTARPGGWEPVR